MKLAHTLSDFYFFFTWKFGNNEKYVFTRGSAAQFFFSLEQIVDNRAHHSIFNGSIFLYVWCI
jgi:hypothetical protein